MNIEALQAEKADLERKLAARERASIGYGQNIIAIKARLAWIDEELGNQ